ncbi:YlxR family protein [Allobranchiibius sp. GilTou73]|uniref:YlxR family protein n=1 Tax=Allobranchiibius sp. GilTou73 TaxID=2904523 RepID=UPI001F30FF4E|nr:YlxR family protein [Allobranchiibius sp. GilTou73]UIJ36598.1 YlxR family protein [Allobranchiibius sp. GilTou73]
MVERRRDRRSTPPPVAHRGLRTCVGCRQRADRSQLLRIAAIAVDGAWCAVPNGRGRHPGRGAWLHPRADCLEQAVRRRALQRALPVPRDGVLNVEVLRDDCVPAT